MNLKLKHKSFILLATLLIVYLIATIIYSTYEHHGFGDSMWWAFMTFTTVGYGDQFPHTLIGRIAGICLVVTAVFVVLPSITAIIAARIIGNKDEFTHEEQEEVIYLLRVIANNTDGGGRDAVRVLSKEEMRRRAGKKKTDGVREYYEGIPIKSPAEEYLFNNGMKDREEQYKDYKKFEKDWNSLRRRLERPDDKFK